MALTSTEIKRLLQPMKDFAPAILRCVEIVESAEEAERTVVEQQEAIRIVKADLLALTEQQAQGQAELATMVTDVAQKRRDAQAEIETLNISVQIVKDQLTAAQRDFDEAQQRQQAQLDALTLATSVKEDQLRDRTEALAKFMAQFPAVK